MADARPGWVYATGLDPADFDAAHDALVEDVVAAVMAELPRLIAKVTAGQAVIPIAAFHDVAFREQGKNSAMPGEHDHG